MLLVRIEVLDQFVTITVIKMVTFSLAMYCPARSLHSLSAPSTAQSNATGDFLGTFLGFQVSFLLDLARYFGLKKSQGENLSRSLLNLWKAVPGERLIIIHLSQRWQISHVSQGNSFLLAVSLYQFVFVWGRTDILYTLKRLWYTILNVEECVRVILHIFTSRWIWGSFHFRSRITSPVNFQPHIECHVPPVIFRKKRQCVWNIILFIKFS